MILKAFWLAKVDVNSTQRRTKMEEQFLCEIQEVTFLSLEKGGYFDKLCKEIHAFLEISRYNLKCYCRVVHEKFHCNNEKSFFSFKALIVYIY